LDIDLLFTAIKDSDWKTVSESGSFKPESVEEKGRVRCFLGDEAENIINHYFDKKDTVLLIVLDPLRIQSPIKHIKEDGFKFVAVQDAVTIDAIIDKIKLTANKQGKFTLNVKHFD
jgi:uncharacterized protein (DUF952 family)